MSPFHSSVAPWIGLLFISSTWLLCRANLDNTQTTYLEKNDHQIERRSASLLSLENDGVASNLHRSTSEEHYIDNAWHPTKRQVSISVKNLNTIKTRKTRDTSSIVDDSNEELSNPNVDIQILDDLPETIELIEEDNDPIIFQAVPDDNSVRDYITHLLNSIYTYEFWNSVARSFTPSNLPESVRSFLGYPPTNILQMGENAAKAKRQSQCYTSAPSGTCNSPHSVNDIVQHIIPQSASPEYREEMHKSVADATSELQNLLNQFRTTCTNLRESFSVGPPEATSEQPSMMQSAPVLIQTLIENPEHIAHIPQILESSVPTSQMSHSLDKLKGSLSNIYGLLKKIETDSDNESEDEGKTKKRKKQRKFGRKSRLRNNNHSLNTPESIVLVPSSNTKAQSTSCEQQPDLVNHNSYPQHSQYPHEHVDVPGSHQPHSLLHPTYESSPEISPYTSGQTYVSVHPGSSVPSTYASKPLQPSLSPLSPTYSPTYPPEPLESSSSSEYASESSRTPIYVISPIYSTAPSEPTPSSYASLPFKYSSVLPGSPKYSRLSPTWPNYMPASPIPSAYGAASVPPPSYVLSPSKSPNYGAALESSPSYVLSPSTAPTYRAEEAPATRYVLLPSTSHTYGAAPASKPYVLSTSKSPTHGAAPTPARSHVLSPSTSHSYGDAPTVPPSYIISPSTSPPSALSGKGNCQLKYIKSPSSMDVSPSTSTYATAPSASITYIPVSSPTATYTVAQREPTLATSKHATRPTTHGKYISIPSSSTHATIPTGYKSTVVQPVSTTYTSLPSESHMPTSMASHSYITTPSASPAYISAMKKSPYMPMSKKTVKMVPTHSIHSSAPTTCASSPTDEAGNQHGETSPYLTLLPRYTTVPSTATTYVKLPSNTPTCVSKPLESSIYHHMPVSSSSSSPTVYVSEPKATTCMSAPPAISNCRSSTGSALDSSGCTCTQTSTYSSPVPQNLDEYQHDSSQQTNEKKGQFNKYGSKRIAKRTSTPQFMPCSEISQIINTPARPGFGGMLASPYLNAQVRPSYSLINEPFGSMGSTYGEGIVAPSLPVVCTRPDGQLSYVNYPFQNGAPYQNSFSAMAPNGNLNPYSHLPIPNGYNNFAAPYLGQFMQGNINAFPQNGLMNIGSKFMNNALPCTTSIIDENNNKSPISAMPSLFESSINSVSSFFKPRINEQSPLAAFGLPKDNTGNALNGLDTLGDVFNEISMRLSSHGHSADLNPVEKTAESISTLLHTDPNNSISRLRTLGQTAESVGEALSGISTFANTNSPKSNSNQKSIEQTAAAVGDTLSGISTLLNTNAPSSNPTLKSLGQTAGAVGDALSGFSFKPSTPHETSTLETLGQTANIVTESLDGITTLLNQNTPEENKPLMSFGDTAEAFGDAITEFSNLLNPNSLNHISPFENLQGTVQDSLSGISSLVNSDLPSDISPLESLKETADAIRKVLSTFSTDPNSPEQIMSLENLGKTAQNIGETITAFSSANSDSTDENDPIEPSDLIVEAVAGLANLLDNGEITLTNLEDTVNGMSSLINDDLNNGREILKDLSSLRGTDLSNDSDSLDSSKAISQLADETSKSIAGFKDEVDNAKTTMGASTPSLQSITNPISDSQDITNIANMFQIGLAPSSVGQTDKLTKDLQDTAQANPLSNIHEFIIKHNPEIIEVLKLHPHQDSSSLDNVQFSIPQHANNNQLLKVPTNNLVLEETPSDTNTLIKEVSTDIQQIETPLDIDVTIHQHSTSNQPSETPTVTLHNEKTIHTTLNQDSEPEKSLDDVTFSTSQLAVDNLSQPLDAHLSLESPESPIQSGNPVQDLSSKNKAPEEPSDVDDISCDGDDIEISSTADDSNSLPQPPTNAEPSIDMQLSSESPVSSLHNENSVQITSNENRAPEESFDVDDISCDGDDVEIPPNTDDSNSLPPPPTNDLPPIEIQLSSESPTSLLHNEKPVHINSNENSNPEEPSDSDHISFSITQQSSPNQPSEIAAAPLHNEKTIEITLTQNSESKKPLNVEDVASATQSSVDNLSQNINVQLSSESPVSPEKPVQNFSSKNIVPEEPFDVDDAEIPPNADDSNSLPPPRTSNVPPIDIQLSSESPRSPLHNEKPVHINSNESSNPEEPSDSDHISFSITQQSSPNQPSEVPAAPLHNEKTIEITLTQNSESKKPVDVEDVTSTTQPLVDNLSQNIDVQLSSESPLSPVQNEKPVQDFSSKNIAPEEPSDVDDISCDGDDIEIPQNADDANSLSQPPTNDVPPVNMQLSSESPISPLNNEKPVHINSNESSNPEEPSDSDHISFSITQQSSPNQPLEVPAAPLHEANNNIEITLTQHSQPGNTLNVDDVSTSTTHPSVDNLSQNIDVQLTSESPISPVHNENSVQVTSNENRAPEEPSIVLTSSLHNEKPVHINSDESSNPEEPSDSDHISFSITQQSSPNQPSEVPAAPLHNDNNIEITFTQHSEPKKPWNVDDVTSATQPSVDNLSQNIDIQMSLESPVSPTQNVNPIQDLSQPPTNVVSPLDIQFEQQPIVPVEETIQKAISQMSMMSTDSLNNIPSVGLLSGNLNNNDVPATTPTQLPTLDSVDIRNAFTDILEALQGLSTLITSNSGENINPTESDVDLGGVTSTILEAINGVSKMINSDSSESTMPVDQLVNVATTVMDIINEASSMVPATQSQGEEESECGDKANSMNTLNDATHAIADSIMSAASLINSQMQLSQNNDKVVQENNPDDITSPTSTLTNIVNSAANSWKQIPSMVPSALSSQPQIKPVPSVMSLITPAIGAPPHILATPMVSSIVPSPSGTFLKIVNANPYYADPYYNPSSLFKMTSNSPQNVRVYRPVGSESSDTIFLTLPRDKVNTLFNDKDILPGDILSIRLSPGVTLVGKNEDNVNPIKFELIKQVEGSEPEVQEITTWNISTDECQDSDVKALLQHIQNSFIVH